MRITTPFTATSTAADVINGIDLGGKRAIVTGAASGIGIETARALAGAGAEVTLAVRDVAAGERVASDIAQSTNNRHVSVARLDLSVRSSVADFVKRWSGPIHMLVNNAGVMASPLARTAEGWEMQFATNHLGHFALTLGLQPFLAAAGRARVVSVSSAAHLRGEWISTISISLAGRTSRGWRMGNQKRRTSCSRSRRRSVGATKASR